MNTPEEILAAEMNTPKENTEEILAAEMNTPKENMPQVPQFIEIVVSRYNENLAWTLEPPFNEFKYTVYNKGPNKNFIKKNVTKIINLPNVGRCDHTYLHHVVKNYDNNLALITVFLPGSVHMSNKITLAKNLLKFISETKSAIFIACHSKNIRNEFATFTLSEYACGCSENIAINPSTPCFPALIRPYSSWFDHHFGNILVKSYNVNGIFSVDRRDILQNNKDWYIKFLYGLSRHHNPEAGHFTERSWAAIFYPLKNTIIMKKQ